MTDISSLIATDLIQVEIEIRLGRTRLTVQLPAAGPVSW